MDHPAIVRNRAAKTSASALLGPELARDQRLPMAPDSSAVAPEDVRPAVATHNHCRARHADASQPVIGRTVRRYEFLAQSELAGGVQLVNLHRV
jgi:hypothetical protein